jgi:hypothetical protein
VKQEPLLRPKQDLGYIQTKESDVDAALQEIERAEMIAGGARIQIFSDLWDDIIKEDKQNGPLLRRIKDIYDAEIEVRQLAELRDLKATNECLLLDYDDLKKKYAQLEQDYDFMYKELKFRNSQIITLEELIARKDRDIERVFSEQISKDPLWQRSKVLENTIDKLQTALEERAPAYLQRVAVGVTTEQVQAMEQRIKELEEEVAASKARESDLQAKHILLRMQMPLFANKKKPGNNSNTSTPTTHSKKETQTPAHAQTPPSSDLRPRSHSLAPRTPQFQGRHPRPDHTPPHAIPLAAWGRSSSVNNLLGIASPPAKQPSPPANEQESDPHPSNDKNNTLKVDNKDGPSVRRKTPPPMLAETRTRSSSMLVMNKSTTKLDLFRSLALHTINNSNLNTGHNVNNNTNSSSNNNELSKTT